MSDNNTLNITLVRFVKIGRSWTAQGFTDPDTCVAWQTVGSLRNAKRIIKTQLDGLGIDSIIVDPKTKDKTP